MPTVALVLAFTLVLVVPGQAEANWNFDPSCSATNTTYIEEPDPPNVYMMLDKSGSMGFLTDGSGNSLWSVAVNSIDNVTSAMEDEVRFGLGLFPCSEFTGETSCTCWWWFWGWCLWWNCSGGCSSNSGAAEAVVSDYHNHDDIVDALDNTDAQGGTPTWDAFKNIGESDSMNESDRSTGGVMITDGNPCCHGGAEDDAIDEACNMRDEDHLVYVAGLGGSTDQNFNNKLAAATGTGECSDGDPCYDNVSRHNCEGAFHANNQTEFQNVITEIGDTLQCTFEIDLSQHDWIEAPDDPGATRVEILTASGWEQLEHRDESDDGEGWYYPSGESNDQVTLTSKYCNKIQEGDVHEVETQLACDCTNLEGDTCTVSNPQSGECSEGTYYCDQGFAKCEPLPMDQCPTACDDMNIEGDSCHVVNDADLTVQDLAEGEVPGQGLDSERNRCNVGEIQCVDQPDGSQDVTCTEALRPMPELCDGMDSSCSGSIDDISQSWDDWRDSQPPFEDDEWDDIEHLEEQWQGPTCNERNMCSCDQPGTQGPRDDHAGSDQGPFDSVEDEFEAYLDAWSADYCQCTVSLESE